MKTKKKIFLVVILIFIFVGLFYIFYLKNETYDCFDYIDTKDYQKAIETGKKVLKLDSENVDAYICLGEAYNETGQIDLAIDILKKAESYATKDYELMGIYNLLGVAYETKGDLDTALSYSSKSLRLAKKLGDIESETKVLGNIAGIFYEKGELDKALEYFKESLRSTTDEKINPLFTIT
ncbi:MAG: tetratricopeptide repeat protein [Candidatus Aenigmatarchaeota archaeon]